MNSLNEILNAFIIQSKTGNLKVSHYPKEYLDLKMKVSFGMGASAKIPWISFTGKEMQTSNGFYPVYLYYKSSGKLILSYGISETKEFKISWPEDIISNKQKIKDYIEDPFRYGDSWVYKSFIPSTSSSGDEIKWFTGDNRPLNPNELEANLKEIIDQYKKAASIQIEDVSSPLNQGMFYLESQLEEFIIENWEQTELGQKYDLIKEDGELVSQQYHTDVGIIDILAKDKVNKNHVVIELKKGQTSDKTIGQLTKYMGWIKKHKNDDKVKGIIIAGKYDEKLFYAAKMVPNAEVFLYEVLFRLKEFK